MTNSSLAAGAPGVVGTPLGAVSDTGTSTTSSAVSEGILGRLRRAGVPEDESHVYAEGVRRGGSLVIARLADENVDRGLEIMSNYRPVDIDERGSQWRTEGWSKYDESAGPYTGTGLTEAAASMRSTNETAATRTDRTDLDTSTNLTGGTDRTRSGDETVIPIVEEQLSVGKREVERGGVRVRSYVVETPVEESVTLRDETVNVERRAVNRPADVTADAFRERTIELTETDEEAVVAKTARSRRRGGRQQGRHRTDRASVRHRPPHRSGCRKHHGYGPGDNRADRCRTDGRCRCGPHDDTEARYLNTAPGNNA